MAQPTQPNWIQTNLASRGETKPVGLIESFVALPQTPERLLRKNVAGGSAPDPRCGSALNPAQEGVWGRSPHGGLGAEPTAAAPLPPNPIWLRHWLKGVN